MVEKLIGGQAVMEGVMMLNGKKQAIAVRNPEGKIIIKKGEINPPQSKITNLPFIRGVIKLIYMMVIGIRALNYSTSIAVDEKEEEFTGWSMILFMFFSIAFALFLFKFLPLLATKFLVSKIIYLQTQNFLPNLIDGIIKISIFILYIYLMTLSQETKKLFEYHGAEHKTIRCQESKEKLTPKNAKKYSRFHPRCGTSFIFGTLLISIFVYTIIPFNDVTFWENLLYRILLLPVIMGISYEILRISGKNENNWFFKIITAPGLWMQRLTTKEPNEKQLEVAIKSLEGVM